jgi:hypothetical protein
MVYFYSKEQKPKFKERTKVAHTENGWPHFSHKFPFFCMCLDSCCQNEQGCKCRHCVCRLAGVNHGEAINDPTLQRKAFRQGSIAILAEKEKSDRRQVRGIYQRRADESRQNMRENANLC